MVVIPFGYNTQHPPIVHNTPCHLEIPHCCRHLTAKLHACVECATELTHHLFGWAVSEVTRTTMAERLHSICLTPIVGITLVGYFGSFGWSFRKEVQSIVQHSLLSTDCPSSLNGSLSALRRTILFSTNKFVPTKMLYRRQWDQYPKCARGILCAEKSQFQFNVEKNIKLVNKSSKKRPQNKTTH